MKNNKGFTLLELLAVLIIMAALTAIALPIFTNKGDEARKASHTSNIATIEGQARMYELEGKEIDPAEFYGEISPGSNHPLVTEGLLHEAVENPWAE